MSALRFLPLAALLAPMFVGAPATAQDKAERIEVTLSNFKFTPNMISLRHGQSYVLHLVNKAGGGHNFSAAKFFAAAEVVSADRAKITGGKIELAGGATADLHFTAPAAGSYEIKCTHALHAAFGMTGKFVVS